LFDVTLDHNFEKLRIVISEAEYFDDNITFNIENIQKNKPPSRPPLRLTQNHKVEAGLLVTLEGLHD
jgi:hypothetical protein